MIAFIKSAFSESDGTASFARIQSFIHGATMLALVCHMSWHSASIPDATTLTGVSAFILGPYSVNKISTMFGKNSDNRP